jgi:hypothetical protein
MSAICPISCKVSATQRMKRCATSGCEQVQQKTLLDDLVGEREQLRWDFQAKCLGGLEIDD